MQIISTQSVNVDTVSGANFSSRGIIEAAADALNVSFSNPNGSLPQKGHGENGFGKEFGSHKPGRH